MIEMPIFEDENWYLQQVKKAMIDGRFKNKDKINAVYKRRCIEISKTLEEIISDDDFKQIHKQSTLFEKLVLSSYEELQCIYKKIQDDADEIFTDIVTDDKGNQKKIIKEKWKCIYELYDKMVNKNFNIELVQKYGVKCCPYCNENYIINRRRKNGKSYAMAQIDHFYPRDRFPVFAVSLYNLVPVCAACNHIKSTQEIVISPHNHKYDFSHIKISYSPKSADWIDNPDSIEILFKYDEHDKEFREGMEANLDSMGVNSSYSTHTDYVQEILKKAQVYGKETRRNLLNDFPDLFSSDAELIRIIFGNYIEKNELLKRPLSKLTQDLLHELGIIK